MEQRRRRKHTAQKRVLVVCRDQRGFFQTTPAGRTSLAKLERAVAVVVERSRKQTRCRIEQRAASNRCRKARRTLYQGLKHVANVSVHVARLDASVSVFPRTSWTTDDDLIARADVILAAAFTHEELFVSKGVQPGLLASLARAAAVLKQGKEAIIRTRAQFTQATAAIDRALRDAHNAIRVLRGILATSPDAPVGAVTAVRLAQRIGPRAAPVRARAAARLAGPPSRSRASARLR